MIQKIKQSLQTGTKLFNRHNADNSTNGRDSVGEVLASYTKDIGGKLRTIAIAAMEKVASFLYDVCSIEAEVFEQNGIVSGVEKITGIAVSNSKVDNPAFKNAKRMQIVQCFNTQKDSDYKPGEGRDKMVTIDDLMNTPINLIKQAIGARGMFPSQLFDADSMKDDRELGKIIKERGDFEIKIKDLEKDLEGQKELVKTANTAVVKATAKDMLKERMPKGLTEKQSTFINNKFDPEKLEEVNDVVIDEFIKSGQKEYQELSKLFTSEKVDPSGLEQTEEIKDGDVSIDEAFLEE